jgi:uncharacterized protein (TIGR00106 family)
MVVAEFSITPMVEGETRPYIDAAIDEIKKSGLKFEVEPMGTSIEGDLVQVLQVVAQAHQAVKQKGVERLISELKIEDRASGVTMSEELEGYRASV